MKNNRKNRKLTAIRQKNRIRLFMPIYRSFKVKLNDRHIYTGRMGTINDLFGYNVNTTFEEGFQGDDFSNSMVTVKMTIKRYA